MTDLQQLGILVAIYVALFIFIASTSKVDKKIPRRRNGKLGNK
jgi:hypothetical protein